MGHSHKAHDIHPKKVKVDVLEVLRDLWEKEERYELELRQMESKTKESKPEPERQLRGRRGDSMRLQRERNVFLKR